MHSLQLSGEWRPGRRAMSATIHRYREDEKFRYWNFLMKTMAIKITSADIQGKERDKPTETKVRLRGNKASRIPEILEASIDVFASEGYAGYSANRVAQAVGLRLSTLQHYFGTRDQLLHATIRESYSRYIERYSKLSRNKLRTPEARLDALIDDFFDDVLVDASQPKSSVAAFCLDIWTLAERDKGVSELVVEGNKQLCQIWIDLIAAINPNLSAEECTMRGTLIMAHVQGLIVFCRRSGPSVPERDALRRATKGVWRALSNAST